MLSDPTVSLLIVDGNHYTPPSGGPDLGSLLDAVAGVAESAGVRIEYRL